MSVRAYPAYRESGVPWIGRVPSGWQVARLKILADVRPSGVDKHSIDSEVPVRLCNYVDVYKNDRITADLVFMDATATPSEIERFSLLAGDVLITKDSETPDDIAAAALVDQSAEGVVCGYHLALLRPEPDRLAGGFLFWSLKGSGALAQFSVRAQGITRFGLTTAAIGDVLLAVPPPAEQGAIAAFLDRECGKIDALVAEQERLIALLKEKRQGVISHAVTRGLDPNAPMKDSGVEWLGQVPEHWQVGRIGYYAAVENGATPSRDNPSFWSSDATVPWVSSGEVNQGLVTEPTEFITPEAMATAGLRLIPAGSVLVGLVGQGRTRGMAAMLMIDAAINQNVAAVISRGELDGWFAYFTFGAAYAFVRDYGRGGNQAALNCEILSAFRIPIPPLDEQSRIAQSIRQETSRQDALITEAGRAIVLLRERRAALISAAVTGKIDVRGLVAPEEAKAA